MPPSCETVKKRLHYVKQEGQPVFKFATRKMEEASRIVLERNHLSPRRPPTSRAPSSQRPDHSGNGRAARIA